MDKKVNIKSWSSYLNYKQIYIVGGILLSSLAFYTFKWALNKFNQESLNEWLEEYIEEIKKEYKEEKKNTIYSISFLCKCNNLIQEVKSFLIDSDFPNLEKERFKMLRNTSAYLKLVDEYLEKDISYLNIAIVMFSDRTGIDMNEIQKHTSKYNENDLIFAKNNHNKPYYDQDLPIISNSLLKEVYIFYAEERKNVWRNCTDQNLIMRTNPELRVSCMTKILIFQRSFYDTIKSRYNIDSKYLNQLIEKSKLLDNDKEIQYYYNLVNKTYVF